MNKRKVEAVLTTPSRIAPKTTVKKAVKRTPLIEATSDYPPHTAHVGHIREEVELQILNWQQEQKILNSKLIDR